MSLAIKRRIGIVKKSIFEIKSIVEDCKSQKFGGIQIGLMLWESCVIPFLLNNSSTWFQMKNSDIESLTKLQNLFHNHLLAVQKCPSLMMDWELGTIVMPLRILKEKLLLYKHIAALPISSLAHQFLLVQEELHLPSLKDEVKEFLAEFGVHDVNLFSKKEWRSFVSEKIKTKNRNFLLNGMKTYSKIDHNELALEEFGLKDYFLQLSLPNCRMKFRVRSKTVTSCQTHFPSDQTFIKNSFRCTNCNEFEIDQLSHWHRCNFFKNMREKINSNDEESILEFYRKVIKERQDQQDNGVANNHGV